jgi:hypothetical protein
MGRLLARLILALALVSATAAHGGAINPSLFDTFRPGQTTKADVERVLGPPARTVASPQNHSSLVYQYQAPAAGPGGSPRQLWVLFLFDPGGRFVRYRAYEQDPDGPPRPLSDDLAAPAVAAGAVVLPQSPEDRAYVCEVAVQVRAEDPHARFLGLTRAAQFEGLRREARGEFNADNRTPPWDAHAVAQKQAMAVHFFLNRSSADVVAACDAAFPQTLDSFAVVLPDQPEDRFLVCDGLLNWMLFLSEEHWRPSFPESKPYADLLPRTGPLFQALLEKHGLKPGPALTRIILPPVGRALELGRPDKVLDACIVGLPTALTP